MTVSDEVTIYLLALALYFVGFMTGHCRGWDARDRQDEQGRSPADG